MSKLQEQQLPQGKDIVLFCQQLPTIIFFKCLVVELQDIFIFFWDA